MRSNSGRAIVSIFLYICVSLLGPPLVAGYAGIRVDVEVIKATRKSTQVDPQLKGLVKELAPVLNYSGFSLIKKVEARLQQQKKEDVILPSGRVLEITFLGFKDKQARVQARILERGQETFRTTLLLVNDGSVLIGGPPHEDGVLLLRIGAVFF